MLVSVAPLAILALASPARAGIDNYGLLTGINSSPGAVVEFSTLTNTTIGSVITVGNYPQNGVFTPDGRYAYVVNTGTNSVTVLDVAARTIVATIGVGVDPNGIAISPDGQYVYATSVRSNTVSVISTATNQVVGASIPVGTNPYGLAVSPDGSRVYVANLLSSNVSVVDATTRTVIATIPVGTNASGVAVSPDGSKVYVANQGGSVSVIDTATQTVAATIPLSGLPLVVAFSRDGTRAYVANSSNSLKVIDTANQNIIATVTFPGPAIGVAVTQDGSRIYVSGPNGAYIVDAATNTLVGTIATPISNNANLGTGWIGPNLLVTTGGAVSAGSDAALTTLGFGQYVNFNGGTLQLDASFGTAKTISLLALGGVIDTNGFNLTLDGTIINDGMLTKAGLGILTLTGTNTYTGGTLVTGGLINFNAAANFGTGAITLDGGGLQWATGTSTDISAQLDAIGSNGGTFDTNGNTVTFASGLTGIGSVTKTGAGTLSLASTSTYTGATIINAGILALTGTGSIMASSGVGIASGATFDISGTTAGATITTLAGVAGSTVNLGSQTLTLSNASTAFDGAITGSGGLTLAAGRQTLTGTSTYTGATTINGGTLVVNGSIANSAAMVGSGGTLAGTGTIGSVTVASGGTLAPGSGVAGTTLHVAGNLAFQSGALYLVQINPSAASSTVSGVATLAGTVQAVFAPGNYLTRDYTILTSSSRTGTFDALTSVGLPTGFTARLDYSTPNSVTLKLQAGLGQTDGFGLNQRGVANALNGYFNAGGTLPPGFVGVFGLTGSQLGTALTQLSGEAATGAQQGAFQMTTGFLGLMTDPFVDGRGGGNGALAFAPERAALPPDIASAYASVTKAAPKAPSFEPRWSLWGSAYGGSNRTSGDAAAGSSDVSARTGGFAAGADYQLSPSTMVGFALAGGQTNWSLAQGLGGGRSDSFQAGIHGRTTAGPAYIAGSFAFANHWMTTDRTSFASDRLTASFNAQSYGGRLEAGYRVASPFAAVTPYAAVNAQLFETPSYRENDLSGGGFGLSFAGRSATDTRGEAGARFDRAVAIDATSRLTLRAKLGYAHDWVGDPMLTATFQALPGASFVVSGGAPPRDSGLASAGAEWKFASGIAFGVKFDGEFASRSQTYAGTGTVRYAW